MIDSGGYIKITRGRFMEHPAFIQVDRRALTRWEAYCWLLHEAAHGSRKAAVGKDVVALKRGELMHSQRYMAEAWKWSKTEVVRYIERLKKDGFLRVSELKNRGNVTGPDLGPGLGPTSARVTHLLTLCEYEGNNIYAEEAGPELGPSLGPAVCPNLKKEEERRKRKSTLHAEGYQLEPPDPRQLGMFDAPVKPATERPAEGHGPPKEAAGKGSARRATQGALPGTEGALVVHLTEPDCDTAIARYNSVASDRGLPLARLTSTRVKPIREILKYLNGLDGWDCVLEKVSESQFIAAYRTGNGFRGFNFDSLLQRKTIEGLLEDKYRDVWNAAAGKESPLTRSRREHRETHGAGNYRGVARTGTLRDRPKHSAG